MGVPYAVFQKYFCHAGTGREAYQQSDSRSVALLKWSSWLLDAFPGAAHQSLPDRWEL